MRSICAALLLLGACGDSGPRPDGDQESMELALGAAALPGASTSAEDPAEDPAEDSAEPREAFIPPDGTTEQVIETLDCPRGGTVRVTIRRESSEDPYKRKGYLRWEYEACGTLDYGTIDGNANYSHDVEAGPPWRRVLQYFADLEHTGSAEGDCNAYVKLEQHWHTSDHRLELAGTCPHPVREWWGALGI